MATGSLKSAFSQDYMASSATQMEELGTLRILRDGRKFRYVQADSSGLAAGKMCVAPAAVANHINKAVGAAYAIGATQISLTVGATAVTADQYAEGFLQVNDATGEGYQYKIASNTACDASGTTIIQLEEGLRVALVSATSEVSLLANMHKAVTQTDVEENVPVGVATCAIAASAYGWVQTGGQGICLVIGTPAVGSMLTLAATAGGVTAINATLDIDQPYCAQMLATAGVTTEYKPVKLMID